MRQVAVVGAGPSGVFAAAQLLKRDDVEIDLFEGLPTPYGLVRYGVAPDHLKIKSVTAVLTKVLTDDRVRFCGGVVVGADVSVEELRDAYDSVLLATGAPLSRRLGIPGEELPGSMAAADLVSWYNGHPRAGSPPPTPSRSVAVIGAGNVSLDVARILLKGPRALASTDVPDQVLDVLERTAVAEVHVVARRGVAASKFSYPELLEIGRLDDVDVVVDSAELSLDPDDETRYGSDRSVSQRVDLFREWAGRAPTGASRRLHFRFGWAPVAITGETHVESLVLKRSAARRSVDQPAETLAVRTVIRSIGYAGQAIPGVAWDDSRAVVPSEAGVVAPGLYVAGWAKRGPTGIIGTNKACAAETARALVARLDRLARADARARRDALHARLVERGVHVVNWAGWSRIDAAEISRGAARRCERIKITDERVLSRIATGDPALETATN